MKNLTKERKLRLLLCDEEKHSKMVFSVASCQKHRSRLHCFKRVFLCSKDTSKQLCGRQNRSLKGQPLSFDSFRCIEPPMQQWGFASGYQCG